VRNTNDPGYVSWRRRATLAAFILLAWTFFGLLASFQMFVNTDDERKLWPLKLVLHLSLGNSLLKGVVSLPFIWIFYRAPIPLNDWKRRSVLYFLLLLVFAAIHAAVRPFVIPFVLSGTLPPNVQVTYGFKFAMGVRSFFLDNTWGFFSAVLGFHLWHYARQARERTLNETRLEARLASAELQILKMQLQPHFLFNTLNTVYNLIPVNSKEAQSMITRLSSLLRFSLDHVATETVTLQDEMVFLMEYVQIEKVRFEERLRLERDIPADTLNAEVPNMILQPLVENAIRHGVGKKAAGGTIKVSSRRENGRLLITITDDGAPPAVPEGESTGIGLANTRARLAKLYGQDFSFRIESFGRGTRVSLNIPFNLGIRLGSQHVIQIASSKPSFE
jgi:two-component system, LytTR family, sensor kinase